MKKLFNVFMLTLAVNFLAAAGGIAWLWQTGHLDRSRITQIKAIVFPPPAPTAAATRPSVRDPSTQPTLRLEELLAKNSGLPVTEQLEAMRKTFDAQMAQLDRRQRELQDLQFRVDANAKAVSDARLALDEDRKKLEAEKQESTRLAADKGFQDSLELYRTMAGKSVKTIFMGLDDQTVIQYLQAMEPRQAARITKEYKTTDEIDRLKRIMEKMRQSQPTTATAAAPVKEP